LECAFGVVGKILMGRILMELIWEILIFKRFLLLKIQIKIPKTKFWKEKSVEGRGNTWGQGHRPH
jgi:hypothetical protein